MLLVRWLGNVGLFMLVVRSVAVGWQWWVALIFGGVLFKLVLVVLSLTSVGSLCRLCRWSVAGCCWLMASVLSLGMWVVGVGGREWDMLVDGVRFMLGQVLSGVLSVDGLFVLGLVVVAVSWWLGGFS